MAQTIIFCVTPTDPVSQYTTRCVDRALSDAEPPTKSEAAEIWRESVRAAEQAKAEARSK